MIQWSGWASCSHLSLELGIMTRFSMVSNCLDQGTMTRFNMVNHFLAQAIMTEWNMDSIVGASHHGPEFDDEYKIKELKSMKQSQEELKKLQSLGAFHDFMTYHNKSYATKKEYKYRYGVFKQNMKKVQFLQETELGTGQYGATAVADLTETEFKKNFLGLKPKWKKLSDDPDIHWPAADIPDVELPREFDWREKGAVTEVKNQGMCGSCWAFSVTGNVEGAYFVKHGKLLDLSEQKLVDCDTRDSGCNGGLPENAYKTLFET